MLEQARTNAKHLPHVIHDELCLKCGVCKELCKFDAVKVMTGNGQGKLESAEVG